MRFYWTLLRNLCKYVLKKHKPRIVLVTGSVGKSSARAACAKVLRAKYKVRESSKNFNTESGLAFSILGIIPNNAIESLILPLTSSVKAILTKNFPEILVLELGVDKAGDMDFLLEFFPYKADIAIITSIEPVHLENFSNFEEIVIEKRKILKSLSTGSLAILNADNEGSKSSKNLAKSACMTYGRSEDSDIKTNSLKMSIKGCSFEYEINHLRGFIETKAIASFSDQVIAPAILCGMHFEIENNLIEDSLKDFNFPEGRFTIMENKVIDSSYNASPSSMKACIDTFDRIGNDGEKIAILGDMLELGEISKNSHTDIINYIDGKFDKLILVGSEFKDAFGDKTDKKTFLFDCVNMLDEKIHELVTKNSLVLIKGSQGVGLKKIVKKLNDIK